jgi:membrane protein
VGASAVFSWFIGLSSRYSLLYGSLASIIILLLWLYLCGTILLLGAVFLRVWTKKQPKS